MTFQTKAKVFVALMSAFALSEVSYASPVNSCSNVGLPVAGIATISCNLFNGGSPNPISLLPYQTQNGSLVDFNDLGAGYEVVTSGNPLTLSDNSSGLFNTSLWQAVLFFADDQAGDSSDSVQIFFPGSLPSAATVQSTDEALYMALGTPDSAFFVQGSGSAISFAIANTTFNISTTPTATVAAPEPNSFALMFTGVLGLGLFAARKRLNASFARQV
jgi:hypothetical protein